MTVLGIYRFIRKIIDYITNTPKGMARALTEDHQKRLWIGWKRNHKDNREIFVFMIH